jgi:hypothetical protein
MNNRWRIMGPEVVAKRQQVELYYKAAITTVLNPYNITMRFYNYTTYPSVTPGRGCNINDAGTGCAESRPPSVPSLSASLQPCQLGHLCVRSHVAA